MEFINTINNNSILIIPDNIKNKVLEYIDQNNILKNIKIMNFNELKKGLFFDYNNKTIDYIMTNYKINYSVAKNYINDLSEAIVEIVDNALNHSTSDCLLDIKTIDYRPKLIKKSNPDLVNSSLD